MNSLIEELEHLDGCLRNTDPAETVAFQDLLLRREALLERLPEVYSGTNCGREVVARLEEISSHTAGFYRSIGLYRQMILQRQAALEREKLLLRNLAGALECPAARRCLNVSA